MAIKLKLGQTPYEVKQEDAAREAKRIEEAQQASQERERKLRQILLINKKKKMLVSVILIITVVSLLIFGVYNTFFKKSLTEADVVRITQQAIPDFPVAGLDGYLRQNVNTWFGNSVMFQQGDSLNDFKYVAPDLDSITVDSVRSLSNTFAHVIFSINIETQKGDTFKPVSTPDGKIEQQIVEGARTVKRYSFYIPVEYRYTNNSNGNPIFAGYYPAGTLTIYTKQKTDSYETVSSPYLSFNSELELDDETKKSAMVKVDKILNDLYSGKDTSQDFKSYIPFNSMNLKYSGIKDFNMYSEPNYLGYNAYVTYTVETPEGYGYVNSNYLAVTKNGSTWLINGFN